MENEKTSNDMHVGGKSGYVDTVDRDTSKSEQRLSDLVEREYAEEIAEKHIPETFVWERNGEDEMSKPPKWMVEAMMEYASERTSEAHGEVSPLNTLVRLRQETDKVCAELQEEKADISGAINWGDLGCVNAEKCIDHHGNEYYRVLIEEANPDCSELQARVGEELSKRGFRTFVWTQW